MGQEISSISSLSNPSKALLLSTISRRQLQQGRYVIVDVLGTGGQGITYLANVVDPPPGAPAQVVIKELIEKRMTDRFIEEAEQMKRLKQKHPELRIPNVYDIFQIQDSWFIVMEYIKGSDLKIGSMNWQEALRMGIDILKILEVVHNENVIHRDIKPNNIVVRHQDNEYFLIDFGVCKELKTALYAPTVIGTANFVAPEVVLGHGVYTSDIYSLGVTILFLCVQEKQLNLLINRAIQQGLQGRAILYNVITSTSEELGIYPEITKNILLSMVAPVEDRYHSAAEARIALQGALGG